MHRKSSLTLLAVASMLALTACGGNSGDGSDAEAGDGKCIAEDVRGGTYDACKLAEQDQSLVEGTVGRKFEVDGFGLIKPGQTVKIVCHTSSTGNGSFGIVIPQGRNRTGDMWTLGKVDGKPFAYVGSLIEVAIKDHKEVAKQLEEKLEERFGDEAYASDSCRNGRVIASTFIKTKVTEQD